VTGLNTDLKIEWNRYPKNTEQQNIILWRHFGKDTSNPFTRKMFQVVRQTDRQEMRKTVGPEDGDSMHPLTSLHSAKTQKNIIILIAMKTSNLTQLAICVTVKCE
jgi:hypothetical protein